MTIEIDTATGKVTMSRAEYEKIQADQAERDKLKATVEKMEQAMSVQVCPDCDGDGHLGRCSSGKLQSCEYCGGDEDALGRGFLRYDPPDRMESVEKERDKLKRLVEGIAFMCEDGSREELNVLALIRRTIPKAGA